MYLHQDICKCNKKNLWVDCHLLLKLNLFLIYVAFGLCRLNNMYLHRDRCKRCNKNLLVRLSLIVYAEFILILFKLFMYYPALTICICTEEFVK